MRFATTPALVLLACAAPLGAQDAGLPSAVEQLLIRDSCTQLLLTYGEGLDTRDPLKIWPLFTEDGVWTADGKVAADDQAALRQIWEALAAAPRTTTGRHVIGNIRFTVHDAAHASGTALVVQYRYDPQQLDTLATLAPTMLVDMKMECTAGPDGWKFRRMDLQSITVAGYVHGKG